MKKTFRITYRKKSCFIKYYSNYGQQQIIYKKHITILTI